MVAEEEKADFFLLSIALFVLSCVFVRKRFRFSFDVCDMLRHLTVAFILLDLGVAVDPLPPGEFWPL